MMWQQCYIIQIVQVNKQTTAYFITCHIQNYLKFEGKKLSKNGKTNCLDKHISKEDKKIWPGTKA